MQFYCNLVNEKEDYPGQYNSITTGWPHPQREIRRLARIESKTTKCLRRNSNALLALLPFAADFLWKKFGSSKQKLFEVGAPLSSYFHLNSKNEGAFTVQ